MAVTMLKNNYDIETFFIHPSDVTRIMDKYYRYADGAHGPEHIKSVLSVARYLCEHKGLARYSRAIEYACIFHDAGSSKDNRPLHHLIAAENFLQYVRNNSTGLSAKEISTVVECIVNHRSSNPDIDSCSIEAQIVAAADYGFPSTTREDVIERMLRRSVNYHMSKDYSKYSDAVVDARQHLKEKYGYQGYANYSKLYMDMFGPMLEEQRRLVEECCTEKWEVPEYEK